MTTQIRPRNLRRGSGCRAPFPPLLLIVAVLMSPVPAAPQEADGEIEAVLRHLEGTFPSVVERGELVFTARLRARHEEQVIHDHLVRLRAASQRSGVPMSEREEDDTPVCDEVDEEGRPLGSCRWSRDRIPLYISPPSVDAGKSGTRYSVSFHFVSPGPMRIRQGTIINLFGNHLVFRVVPDEDGTMRVEQLEHMTSVASTTPIPH
jgi:hypothetical protein